MEHLTTASTAAGWLVDNNVTTVDVASFGRPTTVGNSSTQQANAWVSSSSTSGVEAAVFGARIAYANKWRQISIPALFNASGVSNVSSGNGGMIYNSRHSNWVTALNNATLSMTSASSSHVVAWQPMTVLKAVAISLLIMSAAFGNLLVIVSILRTPRLRIIANSFLVSLAFADFLVAVLVMPFNASKELAGERCVHQI